MSGVTSDEKEDAIASDSPDTGRRQYDDDSLDEDDERMTASSKAKKLASGKRADQNRKAQRAFRQRKDKYIKDLELRSQELDIANSLIVQLKEENDRLNEIAKSFHRRVGELEKELEQINSPASETTQVTKKRAAEEPVEDRRYYSVREGLARDANEQQYGPKGHMGSVYSQTQGLL